MTCNKFLIDYLNFLVVLVCHIINMPNQMPYAFDMNGLWLTSWFILMSCMMQTCYFLIV
jgi:hypothetical protein